MRVIKPHTLLAAAIALPAAPTLTPTMAAAQDVPMQAIVDRPGCTINVINSGTLLSRRGGRRLNSTRANSRTGHAEVRASQRERISVIAPTTWAVSPIPGNGDTNFRTRFRGRTISGNTPNFGWRNGENSRRFNAGDNVMEVRIQLIADHTGSGSFPAGNYTAYATLLCE